MRVQLQSSNARAKWRRRYLISLLVAVSLGLVFWSITFSSGSEQLEVHEKLPSQETKIDAKLPDALVTFITPSRLTRGSLHDTLFCLQNQTVPLWKSIIGVDITVSPFKSQQDVNKQVQTAVATNSNSNNDEENFFLSPSEKDDNRFKFVAVDTGSTIRGQNDNGAGKVRNFLIRQHADTEWVAFVDDDDTLSPYYVQKLRQVLEKHPNADIIVFRMRYRKSGRFVPPYANVKNGTLWPSTVGISFAVRRELFVSKENPIVFGSNHLEDFLFIQKAFLSDKTIILTTCIEYYIRSLPYVKTANDKECESYPLLHVWDAIPGQDPPKVGLYKSDRDPPTAAG